jgi:protein ImuB
MSVAHARSLLRNICVSVEPFTPLEDENKLHALARWALHFSPIIAPDPPDGLLIDIEGCAHLFGGQGRLIETLSASLVQLGFPARITVAPTFGCARAVARFGKHTTAQITAETVRAALETLPVAALRIEQATCEALIEIGIEHIGQLLDLPRKELTARFGDALLTVIDQTVGRTPETIEAIAIEKLLKISHAFDGPVTTIDTILAVINKLLTDLVAELKRLQQGVCVLLVELHRIQLEPVCVSLELTHPNSDLAHLWLLLRPKLERVNLGYGVEEVFLRATHTGRVAEEQLTLWPDDSLNEPVIHSVSFGELLDQLVCRLGTRVVAQEAPAQTYVPEQAFQRIHAHEIRAEETRPIYPASRPSRLFDVPEPLRVIAVVPDGPPAWFMWHNKEHDIIASVGPERIALPWWGSGLSQTRDYFTVQDELGRWLWVFRDRKSGNWFVHGEWA